MSVWELDNGIILQLVTPESFDKLPDGQVLMDIFGNIITKGKDDIDKDTRFGYMAVGYPVTTKE